MPDDGPPPSRWGRALLVAVITVQVAVPAVALVVRWSTDANALRFGWQMFSGTP